MIGTDLAHHKMTTIEPQSLSFEEVSSAKAKQAFDAIRTPLIVDDSGLTVTAWNGLPGPLMVWFTDTVGIEGLLEMTASLKDRRATATAVICYMDNNETHVFRGDTHGTLATEPRGDSGFGFDPIFIPDGSTKTFAEMSPEEKNNTSHRGKAAQAFKLFLEKR